MTPYVIDKYVLNLDTIAFIEKKEHSVVVVFCAPIGNQLFHREFRGAAAEALWRRFAGDTASPTSVSTPESDDEEFMIVDPPE